MGWFENQIGERIKKDTEGVEASFRSLSAVVMGKGEQSGFYADKDIKAKNAVLEICKYYKVPAGETSEKSENIFEQLEHLLRPSGIMYRRISLGDKWWKDCVGALLGETQNGDTVALIPSASGYSFLDYETGQRVKLNSGTAKKLKPDAVCFYAALPNKALTTKDILGFMLKNLSMSDSIMIGGASLVIALIGFFMPLVSKLIFSDIIPSGKGVLIVSVSFLLLGTATATFLISVTKNLLQSKITTKMDAALQGAVMGRVINLPVQFFKQYSSGELSSRIRSLNSLCTLLGQVILGAGLTALFSLFYIGQIFIIAPSLVLPAVISIVMQIGVLTAGMVFNTKLIRGKLTAETKLNGLIFSLFSGIQKIKLGGCENRAFAKWAEKYRDQAQIMYNPPIFIKTQTALETLASMCGMLLVFYFAAQKGVSLPQYVAFNAAFGMINGAMISLMAISVALAYVTPILEMASPFLQAVPETSENKRMLKKVRGSIELNNITFRYNENSPVIIDNLSLKIQRGQYVAIVGKTGCGKSTLMRLLLGFEKPNKGAVYYDGEDISKVDLKSLRKHIGVVLQSGKLFQGDIFSNITISAPMLTLEEAWEAAEMAGIAEDIRNMPMGMHTLISEGAGGISGGQRQRIIIARAIAPKPNILMFDEATSALDNITQKQVSDSLAGLKCTRIVIAHRLSTIKQCDRIVVLDKGRIIEDGTFDELVKQNGAFAELASRQMLDEEQG